MHARTTLLLAATLLLPNPHARAETPQHPNTPDYLREIKPLLAERCYACHGALQRKAGLRLDTVDLMRKGGDAGPVIDDDEPEASLLLERVAHEDPELRMPPPGEGTPLDSAAVERIRQWLRAGAPAPENESPEPDPRQHWAFQPPRRSRIPAQAPGRNLVDAHLEHAHRQRDLVPQPPADDATLLRRLHVDLLGVPPTASEIEQYRRQAADDPRAYEKLVDRLLDDPRHAQRWARHWMDIWRYSDWWGLGEEVRNSQKHIWQWRDWIVESLRDDVPYDEMIRQMLAADELHPEDPAKLRATGFLARQYFKFNRDTWLDSTVEHTGKAFLGLTLNCARCHDHKYDPVAQREYYAFRAVFEPHQIRIDQTPGHLDPDSGGIPRAFDCDLDQPTYVYKRGDDKQPLKNDPVAPDVPAALRFANLDVRTVQLPPAAVQPGIQPWVLQNHLDDARAKIETARNSLQNTRQALQAARAAVTAKSQTQTQTQTESESESAPLEPIVETFDAPELDSDRWRILAGDWRPSPDGNGLRQLRDGPERAALRLLRTLPNDFEAELRFTARGGQTWKSVGLALTPESASPESREGEVLPYVSAYEQGPKVQIAHHRAGVDLYPPEAAKPLPAKLGQPVQIRIRVRGNLLNVAVDGQHLLAWRVPNDPQTPTTGPRRLEIIAFDAVADFHAFRLAPLPADVTLVQPPPGPNDPPSAEDLADDEALASAELAAAEAFAETLTARADADRALALQPGHPETPARVRNAARMERRHAILLATRDLARAEGELRKIQRREFGTDADADADADTDANPSENLLKARQARDAAAQARDAAQARLQELENLPLDHPEAPAHTPLRGSVKTVASPTETPEQRNRPFPAVSTGRRAALARWITDPRNPLAARVAVNHVWMRHFHAPLVPTVFDFGRKGRPPALPELLDDLALEFIDSGWSLKRLHRLIVTSDAYRRASTNLGAHPRNLERDPQNLFFWRANPLRVEAQVVRDAMLHLAGQLDHAHGGPPVPPAQQAASNRRSLYFTHSHNDHNPFLAVFDDADVLDCYRREQSVVPQQALALANGAVALDAARAIADRVAAELPPDADDDAHVQRLFLHILAANPNPDERQACRQALQAWREARARRTPDADPADVAAEARARLAHALLNHNDFVTVR